MAVSRFGAIAFLALAIAGPLTAAPGQKGEARADPGAAAAIRKALDSKGKFEFADVTLDNVINTLTEQYKINIVVDRFVVEQMGVVPEGMPVKLNMKEGTLREALRGMVGQYSLTFAIIGDSLVITTEEMAVYRQLKQRVGVDFNEVPVGRAVKDLAARCGVNVVIDPRTVKSRAADNPVTLRVDDVPFEAAVRLLCELADLKPARLGNVIFVTTEARADKLKNGDLAPLPGLPTPGFPGLVPGLLGGIAGGAAVQGPAVIVAPPVEARDEAAPPAKDEVKKEEPKKP